MHLLDCAPTSEVQELLVCEGVTPDRRAPIMNPRLDADAFARVVTARDDLQMSQLIKLCADLETLEIQVTAAERANSYTTFHADLFASIAQNPVCTERLLWRIVDHCERYAEHSTAANERVLLFEVRGGATEFATRLADSSGIPESTATLVFEHAPIHRVLELAELDHTNWYTGLLFNRPELLEDPRVFEAALRAGPAVMRDHLRTATSEFTGTFLSSLHDERFANLLVCALASALQEQSDGHEASYPAYRVAQWFIDNPPQQWTWPLVNLAGVTYTLVRTYEPGTIAMYGLGDVMRDAAPNLSDEMLESWPATQELTAELLRRRDVTAVDVWRYLLANGVEDQLTAGEYADTLAAMPAK